MLGPLPHGTVEPRVRFRVQAALDPAHVDAIEAAIMAAFLDEGVAAVEALVETLADREFTGVDVCHPTTGATPLMVAAAKGAEGAVATLLAHGADVRRRSKDGSNARHWAERFHQPGLATLVEAKEVELAQAEAQEGTQAALAKYQLEVDPNEVRATVPG